MGRPLYIDDTEKLFGSKTPNMPPVPPSLGGGGGGGGAGGVGEGATNAAPPPPPLKPTNDLKLCVFRAKGLPETDDAEVGGILQKFPDVFIRVGVVSAATGKVEYKCETRTFVDDSAPEIRYCCNLDNVSLKDRLRVTAMDRDVSLVPPEEVPKLPKCAASCELSMKIIGTVMLPAEPGVDQKWFDLGHATKGFILLSVALRERQAMLRPGGAAELSAALPSSDAVLRRGGGAAGLAPLMLGGGAGVAAGALFCYYMLSVSGRKSKRIR